MGLDIFREFESDELELAARVLGVREEDLPMMATADREVTWQPPVETKGPGTYVNVKIPDEEVRLMDIVVHLEESPFKTRADFVRSATHYFSRVWAWHHRIRNPKLMEVLNRQLMEVESNDLRLRVEDIHRSAITLRDDLVMHLSRDERNASWIKLRQYYDRVSQFDQVTGDRYLRILYEVPIVKLVAWSMREWPDRIPDEFIPETEPYEGESDWVKFLGDEGIPPNLKQWNEGPKEKFDRKKYMSDYMRTRRANERQMRELDD